MYKQKAFTLLELLFVIAVISMLMAILLPSLGKIRYAARKVACQTNLMQLMTAWNYYANDNDDTLVSAYTQAGHDWVQYGNYEDFFNADQTDSNTHNKDPNKPLNQNSIIDSHHAKRIGPKFKLDDKTLKRHAKDSIRKGSLFGYIDDIRLYECPDGWKEKRDYSISWDMNGEKSTCKKKLFELDSPRQSLVFLEENDPRQWNVNSWILGDSGRIFGDTFSTNHRQQGSNLAFADGTVEFYKWQDKRTKSFIREYNGLTQDQINELSLNNPDLKYFQTITGGPIQQP